RQEAMVIVIMEEENASGDGWEGEIGDSTSGEEEDKREGNDGMLGGREVAGGEGRPPELGKGRAWIWIWIIQM
ncbi:hypothetical protein U1Q18_007816, partial [Sarracenia purpurea var. burkii]